jgi:hypothetical protein
VDWPVPIPVVVHAAAASAIADAAASRTAFLATPVIEKNSFRTQQNEETPLKVRA